MKKLKYVKKIKEETNEFAKIIEKYCEKLNKEYAKKINTIVESIAKGEGLDIDMIKNKYMASHEHEEDIDEVLDKITISDVSYYYVPKEGGEVYDINTKIVGKYENNMVVFN